MFEPARWMLLALACATVPRAVRAQTVAEYRRDLDSLGREWRAAIVAKNSSDSARTGALPSDTVRVGHVVVLTEPRHEALARSTLQLLAAITDSTYGKSAATLVQHPFVLRTNGSDSSEVASGITDSTGVIQLSSSDFNDASALANSWRQKIEAVMTSDIGDAFSKWLGGPIPSQVPTAQTWIDSRIQLVVTDSRVAQDCVRSDINECLKAFSLVPIADPALDWYDAAQQRDILEHDAYALRRSDPATYDRCMTASDRLACAAILHAIPPDAIPEPISSSLRQSLVRYALMVGGAGAFDRLAQTPGTPGQRLASAAREPIDSLVRGWRGTVMETQNTHTAIDLGTAIASIAWAGIFAALSLRSSRWR